MVTVVSTRDIDDRYPGRMRWCWDWRRNDDLGRVHEGGAGEAASCVAGHFVWRPGGATPLAAEEEEY